jgi:hypothetical protein
MEYFPITINWISTSLANEYPPADKENKVNASPSDVNLHFGN